MPRNCGPLRYNLIWIKKSKTKTKTNEQTNKLTEHRGCKFMFWDPPKIWEKSQPFLFCLNDVKTYGDKSVVIAHKFVKSSTQSGFVKLSKTLSKQASWM